MKTHTHPLLPLAPGNTHTLTSLHFGPLDGQAATGPKVVIQASLHADEVPGMLVAHHLRKALQRLEAEGRVRGEVVLVPAANPLGLQQWLHGAFQGRFELGSGSNFNRDYADLTEAVASQLQGRLTGDAARDVPQVRTALRQAVAELPTRSSLESLRNTLLGLAIDADIVLDLHSDAEAVLHLYTANACWPQAQALADCLGAQVALLADRSGGDPFDEACSMVWPDLAARLGVPLPQACLSVTVELRGEADVRHELAQADAEGILRYLALRGSIDSAALPGTHAAAHAASPATTCEALPLAGAMPIHAPAAGVVVFACEVGHRVRAGDLLAELIDPVSGSVTPLRSPVDGLFFARDNRRFARAGARLGKVAGRTALRQGALLSP